MGNPYSHLSKPFHSWPDDKKPEEEEEEKEEGDFTPALTPGPSVTETESGVTVQLPQISGNVVGDVRQVAQNSYTGAQDIHQAVNLGNPDDALLSPEEMKRGWGEAAWSGLNTLIEFTGLDQPGSALKKGQAAAIGAMDEEGALYKGLRGATTHEYARTFGPNIPSLLPAPTRQEQEIASYERATSGTSGGLVERFTKQAEKDAAYKVDEKAKRKANQEHMDAMRPVLEEAHAMLEKEYDDAMDRVLHAAKTGQFTEISDARAPQRADTWGMWDHGILRQEDLDDVFLPLDKAIHLRDQMLAVGLEPGAQLNIMADPVNRIISQLAVEVVTDPLNLVGGVAGTVVKVGNNSYRASKHAARTADAVSRVTQVPVRDVLKTVVLAEKGDKDAISTMRKYVAALEESEAELLLKADTFGPGTQARQLEESQLVASQLEKQIAAAKAAYASGVGSSAVIRSHAADLINVKRTIKDLSSTTEAHVRSSKMAHSVRKHAARQRKAISYANLSLDGTSALTQQMGGLAIHIPFTNIERYLLSTPIAPSVGKTLKEGAEAVTIGGRMYASALKSTPEASFARQGLETAKKGFDVAKVPVAAVDRAIDDVGRVMYSLYARTMGSQTVQPAIRIYGLGTKGLANMERELGGAISRSRLGLAAQNQVSKAGEKVGVSMARLQKMDPEKWDAFRASLTAFMRRSASMESSTLRMVGAVTEQAVKTLRLRREMAAVGLPKLEALLAKSPTGEESLELLKKQRELTRYASEAYTAEDVILEAGAAIERGHGRLDADQAKRFAQYRTEMDVRPEMLPLLEKMDKHLSTLHAGLMREDAELRTALVNMVLRFDTQLRETGELEAKVAHIEKALRVLGKQDSARLKKAGLLDSEYGAAELSRREKYARLVDAKLRYAEKLEKTAGVKRTPALTRKLKAAVDSMPDDDLRASALAADIMREALKASDDVSNMTAKHIDELVDRILPSLRGGTLKDLGAEYRKTAVRMREAAALEAVSVRYGSEASRGAHISATQKLKTEGESLEALGKTLVDRRVTLMEKLTEVTPTLRIVVGTTTDADGNVVKQWGHRQLSEWERDLWTDFDNMMGDIPQEDRAFLAMAVLRDTAEHVDKPMYELLSDSGYMVLGRRMGDLPDEMVPVVVELRRIIRHYEELYAQFGFDFMANPVKMMRAWGVVDYVPHIRTQESQLKSGAGPVKGTATHSASDTLDVRLSTSMDAEMARKMFGAIDEINYRLGAVQHVDPDLAAANRAMPPHGQGDGALPKVPPEPTPPVPPVRPDPKAGFTPAQLKARSAEAHAKLQDILDDLDREIEEAIERVGPEYEDDLEWNMYSQYRDVLSQPDWTIWLEHQDPDGLSDLSRAAALMDEFPDVFGYRTPPGKPIGMTAPRNSLATDHTATPSAELMAAFDEATRAGESGGKVILGRLAADKKLPPYERALARHLRKRLGEEEIRVETVPNESTSPLRDEALAHYAPAGRFHITTRFRSAGRPMSGRSHGQTVQTVLHEFIHADTTRVMHAIETEPEHRSLKVTIKALAAYEELGLLMEHARRNLKGRPGMRDYAWKDMHEFLAVGMTDPNARRHLQSLKWGNDESVWTRFVRAIADMIGVRPNNAFVRLVELSERIGNEVVSSSPAIASKARMQNLPPLKSGRYSEANRKLLAIRAEAQELVDVLAKNDLRKGDIERALEAAKRRVEATHAADLPTLLDTPGRASHSSYDSLRALVDEYPDVFQRHVSAPRPMDWDALEISPLAAAVPPAMPPPRPPVGPASVVPPKGSKPPVPPVVDPDVVFGLDPMAITARYLQANRAISTKEMLVSMLRSGVIRKVNPELQSDGTTRGMHLVAKDKDMAPLLMSDSADIDRVALLEGSRDDWISAGEEFSRAVDDMVLESDALANADIGLIRRLMESAGDTAMDSGGRLMGKAKVGSLQSLTTDMREMQDTENLLQLLVKIRHHDFQAGRTLYNPKSRVVAKIQAADQAMAEGLSLLHSKFGSMEKVPAGALSKLRKTVDEALNEALVDIAEEINVMAGKAGHKRAKVSSRTLSSFYAQNEEMYKLYIPRVAVQSMEDMLLLDRAAGKMGSLGRSAHRLQNFFKLRATVINQMFHGRNAVSNVLQNMLDLGPLGAINPDTNIRAARLTHGLYYYERFGSMKQAREALHAPRQMHESSGHLGSVKGVAQKVESAAQYKWRQARAKEFEFSFGDMIDDGFDMTGKGDIYDIDELYATLKLKGGVSEAFTQNVDIQHYEAQLLEGMSAPKVGTTLAESISLSVFDKANLSRAEDVALVLGSNLLTGGGMMVLPKSLGAALGRSIENQGRLTNIIGNMKRTGGIDEAILHANKFLFDYNDLGAFQRTVMRLIFPFFTWNQKNLLLQTEMLLKKPYMYSQFNRIMMDGIPDLLQAVEFKAREEAGLVDPKNEAFRLRDYNDPYHTSLRRPYKRTRWYAPYPGVALHGKEMPNTYISGLGMPIEGALEWAAPLLTTAGTFASRIFGSKGGEAFGLPPNYDKVHTLAGTNPALRLVGHLNFMLKPILETITGHHSFYDTPVEELTNPELFLGLVTGLNNMGPIRGTEMRPFEVLAEWLVRKSDMSVTQDNDATGASKDRIVVSGLANWLIMSGWNPWARPMSSAALFNSRHSISMGSPSTGIKMEEMPRFAKKLESTFGIKFSQTSPYYAFQSTSGEINTEAHQKAMDKQSSERGSTYTKEMVIDPK